eukprot:XP_001694928.1 predicted protein [Chlamydomonas reinhardtii]
MLRRLLAGFAGRDLDEEGGSEESGGRGNLYEGGATPARPGRSSGGRQDGAMTGGGGGQRRSGAKGAFEGALRPGEKKKLRKEKIQAKRSAREAARGFDVMSLVSRIADFAIAGVYGLRHGLQGSGKKKFLLLQSTDRTKAPDAKTQAKDDNGDAGAAEAGGTRGGGSYFRSHFCRGPGYEAEEGELPQPAAEAGEAAGSAGGIGSRLMERMGWAPGDGLGRARQGQAEPLRAFIRPKKLGLGAGQPQT